VVKKPRLLNTKKKKKKLSSISHFQTTSLVYQLNQTPYVYIKSQKTNKPLVHLYIILRDTILLLEMVLLLAMLYQCCDHIYLFFSFKMHNLFMVVYHTKMDIHYDCFTFENGSFSLICKSMIMPRRAVERNVARPYRV
jgi:hypothetical protein